jgi:hypothetical protein
MPSARQRKKISPLFGEKSARRKNYPPAISSSNSNLLMVSQISVFGLAGISGALENIE